MALKAKQFYFFDCIEQLFLGAYFWTIVSGTYLEGAEGEISMHFFGNREKVP